MDPSAFRRAAFFGAAWARTLSRVEQNDPALTKLVVRNGVDPRVLPEVGYYWPGDSDNLARLGEAIGANTNILTLDIIDDRGGFTDVAANNGPFFEGLKRNASVRSLTLRRFDLSAGAGIDLLNAFVTNISNLADVLLSECSLRNGGAGALGSALSRCANLSHISLVGFNVDDDQLVEFSSGVRGLRQQLSWLVLSGNNFGSAGCEALSTLLQDPNLHLTSLRLYGINRFDDDCATILASSLEGNRKLKNLRLDGSCGAITETGWNVFSQVLCNTSSVNATYHSNHTLSSIARRGVPTKIASLLRMNQDNDKQQVAIRKILRHHTHLDMEPFFEWDLKVLPVAVRWFERARNSFPERSGALIDARKLSAIFQFVTAMPLKFVPSGSKASSKRERRNTPR